MIDLHVHTWRCRHGEGTAEDYVRAAAARDVRVLAVTEHLPLAEAVAARVRGSERYAMPASELGDYTAEVVAAAGVGRDVGVEVLCGIEVDALPAAEDHARRLLSAYPFDVVLGSVHFIDDWAFDDPDRTDGYSSWRTRDLWERYFSDVAIAARMGLVDVIAHLELVKKFGYVLDGPLDDLYAEIATVMAETGIAVEVNTAGLRKPCHELYPAAGLLRALARRGVPATIGSDAHRPAEVACDAAAAVDALKDAGYRSVLVFRRRAGEEVGLDEL